MKRVADEGEPVVVIPVVLEPVEVRIALGIVPPDVADVLLAFEGNVPDTIFATAPGILRKAVSNSGSRIPKYPAPSIFIFNAS